jgi:hypothetical protein
MVSLCQESNSSVSWDLVGRGQVEKLSKGRGLRLKGDGRVITYLEDGRVCSGGTPPHARIALGPA